MNVQVYVNSVSTGIGNFWDSSNVNLYASLSGYVVQTLTQGTYTISVAANLDASGGAGNTHTIRRCRIGSFRF
jgi:hypothetical protein